MDKNKKHDSAFKLEAVKEHLSGESLTSVALKRGLSRSLLTRWLDQYSASGSSGLLLKAENELLKKLEALAQAKETPKKKR